ncbi:hypothetical protein [Actinokineospora iranica]|uniref:Uncharacterized protein n=1 Tax=Actinokineospora iranica TaxID=1271860 RepID=A0A1G6T713_9PSEU|nr:hypothetical protein [Actinokineospora iranica]SDD24868.1 hypothetical protein SAMN05216174_1092 [Actinokineospora iranica]
MTVTPVVIELTQRPLGDDEVELVDDVETLGAFDRCSCSAGDDAPYS